MILTRRPTESPGAYIRRALVALTELSTKDLTEVVSPVGTPMPIPPLEAERIVGDLRKRDWRIDMVSIDRHGFRTYRLRKQPEKGEKKDEFAEEKLTEAREWRCVNCGEAPTEIPKSLLGGLGQGKCPTCKRRAALFRHI